jgi:hypothetical protein
MDVFYKSCRRLTGDEMENLFYCYGLSIGLMGLLYGIIDSSHK